MTRREQFLSLILADPAANGPRLVYADWLEEHGEPERAEFIRVQCELAKVPATVFGPRWRDLRYCFGEPWDSLRRRERELLNGRGWGWAGKAIRNASGLGIDFHDVLTFSRGFVSSITCTWTEWSRHADAIRAATPLERVRLTTWPVLGVESVSPNINSVTITGAQQGSQPPIDALRIQRMLEYKWSGITFEPPPIRRPQRHNCRCSLHMSLQLNSLP